MSQKRAAMSQKRELGNWLLLGIAASVLTLWQPSFFPVFFAAYGVLAYRRKFVVALALMCSLLIALAAVACQAVFEADTKLIDLTETIFPAIMHLNLFGLLLIGLLGTWVGTVLDAVNARAIEEESTRTVSLPADWPADLLETSET